jgi:uncharacterized protein involved in type VI secretion and phage assembly
MLEEGLERPLAELSERVTSRLWGKYRGLVENVDDPENRGRITVKVPSVYGNEVSPYALPAVPFAGPAHGMLLLPKHGDGVWIEFEGGNPSLPIWTGFWWARDEMPKPAGADQRVMITPAGLKIIMDDASKKIQLVQTTDNCEITLADDSISITFGQASIVLDSTGVAINGTALKVTV